MSRLRPVPLPGIHTAPIDAFLQGMPPVRPPTRNQFFIEALWVQERNLKAGRIRVDWLCAWEYAFITLACHMRYPCTASAGCAGCAANGITKES